METLGSFRGGLLPAFFILIERRLECLERERGGVMFTRRQTSDSIYDLLLRQRARLFQRPAFKHFRESRTAGQSWWASISEKSRGFNSTIDHAQA